MTKKTRTTKPFQNDQGLRDYLPAQPDGFFLRVHGNAGIFFAGILVGLLVAAVIARCFA